MNLNKSNHWAGNDPFEPFHDSKSKVWGFDIQSAIYHGSSFAQIKSRDNGKDHGESMFHHLFTEQVFSTMTYNVQSDIRQPSYRFSQFLDFLFLSLSSFKLYIFSVKLPLTIYQYGIRQ